MYSIAHISRCPGTPTIKSHALISRGVLNILIVLLVVLIFKCFPPQAIKIYSVIVLFISPIATLESIVDDLVDAIAKTISLTKDDIDLLEQSLLTLHQLLQTYSERTRSLLKERAISIDDQTLKLVNDSVSEVRISVDITLCTS